jgi:hypothetical protein
MDRRQVKVVAVEDQVGDYGSTQASIEWSEKHTELDNHFLSRSGDVIWYDLWS